MKLEDDLHRKIKMLNEVLWDGKTTRLKVNRWLENFAEENRLGALYLLSQFIYLNKFQIKQLLISIYRDYFKYPLISDIRTFNSGTYDSVFLESEFKKVLARTRFINVGNPSESSAHLMMLFRTENKLAKNLFIDLSQISSCPKSIEHYVFIDDICGSGSQMVSYTAVALATIKSINPSAKSYYFLLMGTETGKDYIRRNSSLDVIESVLDLDDTFKTFHEASRIFKNCPSELEKNTIEDFISTAGRTLYGSIYSREGVSEPDLTYYAERDKLGYKDGQLLIGFDHNTPDNTLPVIWYNEDMMPWKPIFKRFHKIYS